MEKERKKNKDKPSNPVFMRVFRFVFIILYGHSHAALMVELGYSIVAVAERLGDTVEVAMATYSHLYPDKMESLAADLDRFANSDVAPAVPAPGTDDLSALSSVLENVEKEAEKM